MGAAAVEASLHPGTGVLSQHRRAVQAEPVLDLRAVALDGLTTEAEPCGHLAFAQAEPEQFEDAQLAVGEAVHAAGGAGRGLTEEAFEQRDGERLANVDLTSHHGR